MAYILADSVGETTTTTGTGALTLAGATFGRRAFGAVMADGDTAIVRIQHLTEDEWEIALAEYDADTDTLSRKSVIASSNGNAAVNFSAGTKIVEMVASATDFRRVRSAATGAISRVFTRNEAGLITKIAYADGRELTFTRDASGTITGKVDQEHTWQFVRDSNGLITEIIVTPVEE